MIETNLLDSLSLSIIAEEQISKLEVLILQYYIIGYRKKDVKCEEKSSISNVRSKKNFRR